VDGCWTWAGRGGDDPRMEQGKVVGTMSMSLDGFVADPFDRAERLFGWHGNSGVTHLYCDVKHQRGDRP
jgi:hypothetical protein